MPDMEEMLRGEYARVHRASILKSKLALLEASPERDAEAAADEASRIRRLGAQAEALREAADMACPTDVKDFGERHGIPRFAELTWQAGFEAGYAAGLARLRDRRRDEAE